MLLTVIVIFFIILCLDTNNAYTVQLFLYWWWHFYFCFCFSINDFVKLYYCLTRYIMSSFRVSKPIRRLNYSKLNFENALIIAVNNVYCSDYIGIIRQLALGVSISCCLSTHISSINRQTTRKMSKQSILYGRNHTKYRKYITHAGTCIIQYCLERINIISYCRWGVIENTINVSQYFYLRVKYKPKPILGTALQYV